MQLRDRCIHRIEDDSSQPRAFLSVADKGGVSYRSLDEVLSSPDLQSIVLKRAETDLLAFENRYRALEDICVLIREARERVAAKRRNAKQESRVTG